MSDRPGFDPRDLDNYITGHYGEDQLRDDEDLDGEEDLADAGEERERRRRNLAHPHPLDPESGEAEEEPDDPEEWATDEE